jgi:8-oxo-dGTP pyrophosphatase MutT (NUDIX family)
MMPDIIRAAGCMFIDPEGHTLLLRRTSDGDAAGTWCFPGGKIEDGETAEQAAIRECGEEIGQMPKGKLVLHTRRIGPALAAPQPISEIDVPVEQQLVDFTTFLVRVPQQFEPKLNEEHDGYVWTLVSNPQEPLHPGCRISLAKLFMDELDIAHAMVAGELTSPQRYMNVTLWSMRITGTGMAFRKNQTRTVDGKEVVYDEHVVRPPEEYLNERFLQRCNGLAVIWEHPKKATLTSKEYANRSIGSIMVPFIKGDEVWGIAKVYDDQANEAMEKDQLSTSPTVQFSQTSVNQHLAFDDGTVLLIEGKPALLDHVAVCERGVWDKGGDPGGISNDHITKGDSEMAGENDKKEDAVKSDAATIMDAVKSMCDSVGARMDAMNARFDSWDEEKKKDAAAKADAAKADAAAADAAKADAAKKDEEDKKDDAAKKDAAKSDVAKKDGDEAEETAADKKKDATKSDKDEDEKKEDAVKSDSVSREEFVALQNNYAALAAKVPVNLTDDDARGFADSQAKADAVLQVLGKHAPRPLHGESKRAYDVRLGRMLQPYSARYKGVDLAVIAADSVGFEIALEGIRSDAMAAAMKPTDLGVGEFRKIERTTPTGHKETSWVGSQSFIKAMSRPARHLSFIGKRAG